MDCAEFLTSSLMKFMNETSMYVAVMFQSLHIWMCVYERDRDHDVDEYLQ